MEKVSDTAEEAESDVLVFILVKVIFVIEFVFVVLIEFVFVFVVLIVEVVFIFVVEFVLVLIIRDAAETRARL